ncbi:polymer-forming cytoskeletal protein [Thermovorax subterraneus]|nr:polymer-forming cytoskeletal protein [Thermovorax subterraneus]
MGAKISYCALCCFFLFPAFASGDGGNITQIGEDVVVNAGEVLNGDAVAIMGDVIVDGRISGDAVAVMGDVIVSGTVEGDATAVGGRVMVEGNGRVLGKISQVGIAGGIGEVLRNPGKYEFYWNPKILGPRSTVFNFLRLLCILALGALTIALFPNNVEVAANVVDKDAVGKLIKGLVLMLLMPVVVLLLVFTLIGIPLIPAVFLLAAIAGFFGYVAISVFMGRRLNEHVRIASNLFTEYLLGALVLGLVQLMPFLGWIVSLAVFILSLGITFDSRFGTRGA